NGPVKSLAKPDIKLNGSTSVCVGIHELPPGGPSFRPHPPFRLNQYLDIDVYEDIKDELERKLR
ncbi:hypothetical protein, partial [Pararhizobium sp. PWRC1-1]|uniref:hypothetical protein n=1 Tax=Pararhizobium sp. PWRC1-1 TaxID=2804566 RepID=UPI003CF456B1